MSVVFGGLLSSSNHRFGHWNIQRKRRNVVRFIFFAECDRLMLYDRIQMAWMVNKNWQVSEYVHRQYCVWNGNKHGDYAITWIVNRCVCVCLSMLFSVLQHSQLASIPFICMRFMPNGWRCASKRKKNRKKELLIYAFTRHNKLWNTNGR